ncbi:hypothetical protein [Pectobacterium aroidearum]|nr:hypothetical protein [Pectobacterium aroidearum]MDY4388429.1 hypothetical protein [Pectobacterium aroidearum]
MLLPERPSILLGGILLFIVWHITLYDFQRNPVMQIDLPPIVHHYLMM